MRTSRAPQRGCRAGGPARPRSQLRAAASCGRNRGIKFLAGLSCHKVSAYSRMMKVADGDCERVSCVVRLGSRREREQHPNHLLNLMLVSIAVAGDCLLDQPWRVLTNFQRRAFRREQGNAAYLAQFQSDFGISGVEGVFDRTGVGLESADYFFEPAADFQKSGCKTRRRR